MKGIFLALILLYIACEQTTTVSSEIFSKMISHRNLGLAYLEEERLNESAEEFKALIQLAHEEPLGHANLGLVYLRMNDQLVNAEQSLNQALKLSPDNSEVQFLIAKLYEITARNDEALNTLENILVKDPEHLKTLYQLGITLSRSPNSDDKERAIGHLKKVFQISPSNIASTIKLIELLLETKRSDDALYHLQILNQTIPKISQAGNDLLRNVLDLLHAGNSLDARVPMIMFHNLLKPEKLYQTSLIEVRGTNGPIAGNPIVHFMKIKAVREIESDKQLNNIVFEDATSQTNLEMVNKIFDLNISNNKHNPIFALGDYDLDGDLDLFISVTKNSENENHQLFFENNGGYFSDKTSNSGIKHKGEDLSAIFSDYNNDGYVDLHICNNTGNKIYENLGNGKFSLKEELILSENEDSHKALFLDLDLEGDLDLFIITESNDLFFRNNSDGSFTEMSDVSGLSGNNKPGIDIAYSDFDDDGDLDLFVLNRDGTHYFYDNRRQGQFKDISKFNGIKKVNNPIGITTVDYNHDGLIDVFISGNNSYSLYKNLGDFEFILDSEWFDLKQVSKDYHFGKGIFFDADNDGYLDLLISLFEKRVQKSSIQILCSNGNGKFLNPLLISNEISGQVKELKVADYDGDGDLDIFASSENNRIQVLRNDGGNINNFIKVKLTGLRTGSGKNNYFGIGSKIELKAGDIYQIKYVDEPVSHFGIGEELNADVLRVVWSNGVPQNRFKPRKNQTIVEKQILKGSCPYLFGWSGNQFEFITDVLWPSALGMPLGIMAGEPLYAFPNSTDEYLRVPGNKLKMVNGSYVLQFTTELWETPYLDKIGLKVIDHPNKMDVYIDEAFTPPPFPSSKIYGVKEKYIPTKAMDSQGNDLIKKLKKRDNIYVSNLYHDLYQGVTEFHDLVLEFENINSDDSLFLFLQGWLFPTDASINVNLSHSENLRSIFPYLQIPNENGTWETIIDNLGFPKGKNKTMIVDLTNRFNNHDYRIRLRTNMQIYWDHIFMANSQPHDEIRVFELEPTYADLHYRGFSVTSQKDNSSPHIPDYYNIEKGQKWRDLTGTYTRYGDILELLLDSDNKYAIMNAGDEITIKFDASSLPDLKNGWARDFLFYNDGWLKDGDLNTAEGQTVEPLPFHGMTSYPEGAYNQYPIDKELENYRKEYNTRDITTEEFKSLLKTSN